jgi:hypothetical protein
VTAAADPRAAWFDNPGGRHRIDVRTVAKDSIYVSSGSSPWRAKTR